eukprot:COSAG01_NODE_24944_length_760_cov_442.686838_1_plen_164_part_01
MEVALEVGEDHKDDHPDDPRTEDQLGAIHLYTQGWAVATDSLYAVSREHSGGGAQVVRWWGSERRRNGVRAFGAWWQVLNETLSAEDRTLLTVWFSFIKLLMTALAAEPRSEDRCGCRRGVMAETQPCSTHPASDPALRASASSLRYVGTVWRGVAADIGGQYK